MRTLILVVLLAAALVACRSDERTPWVPVLEQTDYVYLQDSVAQALDRLPTAVQLQQEPTEALQQLAESRHELLKLKHYYLPLTEARQLVYDADRLLYLGQPVDSRAKLMQGRALLLTVGGKGGTSVQGAMDKAALQVDQLLPLLDGRPVDAAAAFRSLGESINLMLLKGDLILAGAHFSGE